MEISPIRKKCLLHAVVRPAWAREEPCSCSTFVRFHIFASQWSVSRRYHKHFCEPKVAMAAAFVLNSKLLYKLGEISINYICCMDPQLSKLHTLMCNWRNMLGHRAMGYGRSASKEASQVVSPSGLFISFWLNSRWLPGHLPWKYFASLFGQRLWWGALGILQITRSTAE